MLAAAGVRGWACVPLIRPGRVRGIMGLDSCRPAWDRVFPLSVLRLAGDVVASALEREFLERDRARLTTRLERARRMQMIGSLASGIAHNFNNIISAILGYSEMVEPQLARGTKPAQHIDEIRRAAERGRDLIDNILTFGRQRDARARPVQVRTLFEEAASLLRASLPSDVELIIDVIPVDVAVCGEPAQTMHQRGASDAAQRIDPHHCGAERSGRCPPDEPRRARAGSLRVPSRHRQRTRLRRKCGATIVRAVLHDPLGGDRIRTRNRTRDRA